MLIHHESYAVDCPWHQGDASVADAETFLEEAAKGLRDGDACPLCAGFVHAAPEAVVAPSEPGPADPCHGGCGQPHDCSCYARGKGRPAAEGTSTRKIKRIHYGQLNARQKENYNFQKASAILADYGFNCMRLSDDWKGADFLAVHVDGETTLRVQLKSGVSINPKYLCKDLWMMFPAGSKWFLIPHDTLVTLLGKTGTDWRKVTRRGQSPPMQSLLEPYAVGFKTDSASDTEAKNTSLRPIIIQG